MLYPSRLLHTILDHILQILPAEPAAFKRLDDLGTPEPADGLEPPVADRSRPESGALPDSGVQPTTGVRAAS